LDIKDIISDSIEIKQAILENQELLQQIEKVIQILLKAFQSNAKVLWCGNGGSSADAQHLASELSGRFYLDRAALNSEALHVNTAYLTAVANDYGFEEIFARALEAKASAGDVLIALSTSGSSVNILKAIEKAKNLDMQIIMMTGENGSPAASKCDLVLSMPSSDTPRIQECHMLIGHIICAEVEARFFNQKS